MKRKKNVADAFGKNEFGIIDLPIKFSNVKVIAWRNNGLFLIVFLMASKQQIRDTITDNEAGKNTVKRSGNNAKALSKTGLLFIY